MSGSGREGSALALVPVENSSSSSCWPRWVWVCLVGAPVLGLGYYYLARRRQTKKDAPALKPKTAESTNGTAQSQPRPAPKPETPLERAVSLKNSGNGLFNQGKAEDAIRCYTEAISICPADEKQVLSVLYQNRAAAYDTMNKCEALLEDCNKAIELNPAYIKALNRRYKVAEKLGHLRQSLEDITAICILERFENATSLNHADRVLRKLGKELAKKEKANRSPSMPSKNFIKAYFNSYKHDPVTSGLDQLQFEAQSEGVSLSGLMAAKKALLEGRYDDIVQCCNEQVALDTSSGEPPSLEHYQALLLRASMLILTTESEQALNDLNLIIEENPPHLKLVVTAFIKRATIYLQMEELEKCIEDLAQAETLDPNNSDVFYNRAQVYLLTDRLTEAVSDFDIAVKNCPDFGLAVVQACYARYRLAASTNQTDLVRASTQSLSEAVDKNPSITEGYLLLGQVQADQGNYEEADNAFRTAIDRDPTNATLIVHRGLLELQWHCDIEKAVDYFEKAMEVDPKCELAFETLASVEVQRGNLLRAIELFDAALMLARSEGELMHIFNLKAAAEAQQVVARRLGIPNGAGLRF